MKVMKKISMSILMLAMLIGSSAVSVSAEEAVQDGLKITISTDKETYVQQDEIIVDVNVENTNAFTVQDVKAETIIPQGYKLAENFSAAMHTMELKPGESVTLTTKYKPELKQEGTGNHTDIKSSGINGSTKTGDSTNIFLWLFLVLFSMAGGIVAAVKNKKIHKFLSMFLCLILTGSLLSPVAANAAEYGTRKTVSAEKNIAVEDSELVLKTVVSYIAAEHEDISYTRAEWIGELVSTYGYPNVGQSLEPSFTDISGTEYETEIETAVCYGILNPADENFKPDEPATREFAGFTAIRALGYYPQEEIQCDDSQQITYKKEIFLAVETGMLPLENNKFYPERSLHTEEGKAILDVVGSICDSTKSGGQTPGEGLTFQDGVITLDADINYSDDGTVLKLPLTEELSSLQKDKIIVIGYSDAYKVTEVSVEEESVLIRYTTPDLNEFLDSVDIGGEAAPDFAEFVPAEGVTVNYNSAKNQMQTFGIMDDAFDIPDNSADIGASVALDGDIDLGDGWTVDYSLEFAVPRVDYKFDIDFDPAPNVKNAYLKVQQNTDLSIGFGKDFDGSDYGSLIRDDMLYKYIPLGKVPVVGANGIGAVIEVDLVMNAQGKFEFQYNIAGTLGCQVLNNRPRNISALQSSTSMGLLGEVKVGPKIGLVAELFNQNIISFSADAGARVGAEVHKRSTDLVCIDAGLTLYAELNAFEDTLLDDWLNVAMRWTIWDTYNSPVKLKGHVENMQWVDECTYEGGGTIKGTVAEADNRAHRIPNAKIEVYDSGNLSLEKTVYSDAYGNYRVAVSGGTHLLKISADGYIPFESLETVMDKQEIFLETYLMVSGDENSSEKGTIGGYITNSVTGSGIEGVKLSIRKGWNKVDGDDVISTVTTDENGFYQTELPLGNYTIFMECAHFVSNHINIAVTKGSHLDKHGTMVPDGASEIPTGDMRVVLTWGAAPSDLDSHMWGPTADGNDRFHIYYSDKIYSYDDEKKAFLDVDDTTSYGPETTTVYSMNQGGKYSYYVHDFTNRRIQNSTAMADSGAKVKVYFGENLVATYNIPTNGIGNVWHVFDFDADTRQLIPSNQFSSQGNASLVGAGSSTRMEVYQMSPDK